jgi:hypothetical protein
MVNTTHKLYDAKLNQWSMVRDAISGSEQVKSKGVKYVPTLSSFDTQEYEDYKNRPPFENFVARTLDGLSGLIFSKKPTIEAPSTLETLFDNIDLADKTLMDLAQDTVDELISVGRVGLLVDMASVDTEGLSAADVEQLNIRPYIKSYPTESIINWKYETINNRQVLTMVVLKESKDKWVDEFTNKEEDIYRVLTLDDGIYTVRIFEEGESDGKKSGEYTITQTFLPKMNGESLTEIPFISITPVSLTLTPAKSPLYDLSEVNVSQFALKVDYRHTLHFAAPTPILWGVQPKEVEGTFKVGTTNVKGFANPQGHAEYMEIEGKTLPQYREENADLKESMVVLGSSMLQMDKRAAESENTVAMRTSGQNASLISLADTASRGIQKALIIMSEWVGTGDKVTYKLNTDYHLTIMDSQTITALTTSWLSGAISSQDLFFNLKNGELIEETKTFDEQQTEIQTATPTLTESPIKATNKSTDKSTLQSIREKMGI